MSPRIPIEQDLGSGKTRPFLSCNRCHGEGGYMDFDPDEGRGARVECECQYLRVVKLGYSSNPWRIVDGAGTEVYQWEGYPGGGLPPIQGPLCFSRKRDAEAALDLLQNELAA